MSVTLEEALNHAGYDCANNVDDAEWLLANKEEFDELFGKAEQLKDQYDDYRWEMQELEDSDEYEKVITFEEWRKNKQK